MKNNRAFTLIELLVVVLIIGILAAISLPQYQKAVEKARISEVLLNVKAIKDNYAMFLLKNGDRPSEEICLKDMGGTELSGGEWKDCDATCECYQTKNFSYERLYCDNMICAAEIYRIPSYNYLFMLDDRHDYSTHVDSCWTQGTELGKYICNSVQEQGWLYIDDEY